MSNDDGPSFSWSGVHQVEDLVSVDCPRPGDVVAGPFAVVLYVVVVQVAVAVDVDERGVEVGGENQTFASALDFSSAS